uniref:Ovule protein n=1 Tax=Haemonchus contortus TaxID=6289 RepID=A0A7I4YK82_HAECO
MRSEQEARFTINAARTGRDEFRESKSNKGLDNHEIKYEQSLKGSEKKVNNMESCRDRRELESTKIGDINKLSRKMLHTGSERHQLRTGTVKM